jgi:hypothetical protein
MATSPYEVSSKDNPQTRERTYYVHSVKEIPLEFSAILGDAIQNFRHAATFNRIQRIMEPQEALP